MIKPMTYKGYTAKIEYDAECDCFLGEVLDLNDIITFSGSSPDELKQALKDSVDAYIEYCEDNGEAPEKPFSGKFSVRIDPELHKAVSRQAALTGKSINTFVADALKEAIYPRQTTLITYVDSTHPKPTFTSNQSHEQTIMQRPFMHGYTSQSEAPKQ